MALRTGDGKVVTDLGSLNNEIIVYRPTPCSPRLHNILTLKCIGKWKGQNLQVLLSIGVSQVASLKAFTTHVYHSFRY